MSLSSITARDPVAGWSIARTIKIEGGLTEDPRDGGGVTNYGVSLRWALRQLRADPSQARWLDIDHDGHVDRRDIEGLTVDEAADIYFADWWLTGWFDQAVPVIMAWKCFDVAVNTGPKRSAIILQKALVVVGERVGVDAIVGPLTIAAVAAQNGRDSGVALLGAVRAGQAAFYRRLAVLEPRLSDYLKGWLIRAAL